MSQNEQSKSSHWVTPWLILALFLVFLVWAFMRAMAEQDDMRGEQVTYQDCTVTRNSTTNVKGVVVHDLRTSCGNFTPSNDVEEELEVGQTYDLTTTVGNWANTDPIVLSATISE